MTEPCAAHVEHGASEPEDCLLHQCWTNSSFVYKMGMIASSLHLFPPFRRSIWCPQNALLSCVWYSKQHSTVPVTLYVGNPERTWRIIQGSSMHSRLPSDRYGDDFIDNIRSRCDAAGAFHARLKAGRTTSRKDSACRYCNCLLLRSIHSEEYWMQWMSCYV